MAKKIVKPPETGDGYVLCTDGEYYFVVDWLAPIPEIVPCEVTFHSVTDNRFIFVEKQGESPKPRVYELTRVEIKNKVFFAKQAATIAKIDAISTRLNQLGAALTATVLTLRLAEE